MNIFTLFKQFAVILGLSVSVFSNTVYGQTASSANTEYAAFPPTSAESAPPIVMLTMSRDHQYFFKAYSDFSDLDPENSDGVEITYKNSFDYYGYFQSNLCYGYETVSAIGVFVPKAVQNTPYYCDDVSGSWSGNFLNWVSMTRMDIIRKVLYGGKRKVDTASYTVLERAYLPPDGHSFVKYYNGADIAKLTPFAVAAPDSNGADDLDEGITICNTTQFNSVTVNTGGSTDAPSQTNTNPPVMRFAQGNYQLWTSNERVQCAWDRFENGNPSPSDPYVLTVTGANSGSGSLFEGSRLVTGDIVNVHSGIDAYDASPSSADALTDNGAIDIQVHVAACVADSGGTILDIDSCVDYPAGNSKPTGLLQAYGEQDLMSFGLMTGSYTNNLQGGALRKNVASFANEVNVDSDGTFIAAAESIVNTIDAFRIYGYIYTGTRYSDCQNNRADITEDPCRAWGNPISEIYRDSLLYLAGTATPSHSTVTDSTYIANTDSVSWQTVLDEDNQCADLNNIVFNGSVSTYDDDAAEISLNLLPGGGSADSWTNIIGADESIHGASYYVGNNGTDNNDLCSSKTVTALSDVKGLCPEGPSKDGSYALAGLAYYAQITDLDTTLDGDQTVNTYGISLASSNAIIEVPVETGIAAGNVITMIPAGTQYQGSSGALVDFRVVEPHALISGSSSSYYGKFFVSYEVSVAGNDYDTDATGTIEYVLDETNQTIEVTTVALNESAGSTAGLFGFVIGGTTQDGFHAYSGDAGGSGGADSNDSTNGVPGCTDCRSLTASSAGRAATATSQFGPQSHLFTLGTSSANSLESPLYYAAKWGNFDDNNANGKPDADTEWDAQDNFTGASGSDGLPDDYFFVSNPAQLEEAVSNTLNKILAERESSGTAPANLANADGSGGLIVQALYYESEKGSDVDSESAAWTGEIKVFFIDEYGFYREDGNGNGQLDDTSLDPVFVYAYDAAAEELNIIRYQFVDPTSDYDDITNPIDFAVGAFETVSATELESLWSGDDFLSSLENATISTQRAYNTAATTTGASRYMFTWFDKDRDYKVDAGEQVDFVEGIVTDTDSTSQAANFGKYLVADNDAEAENIINFVRGEEGIDGFRNRTVTDTVTGGGSIDVVKRLGDIVNSTPLIVSGPNSAYDTLYGDSSYEAFRNQYANRRQVTYVGGNDGLLHAFNGGFRDFSASSDLFFTKVDSNDASVTQHELGAELWAYAPNNLLPHLRYLTDPFYLHTFYVDGPPVSYDVNIFADDADHPNGWGTILVVGMRLGGGDIGVNLDGDDTTEINANCKDWCARSAYIILDVTNPENPPKVIAEINDNLLNTATSVADTDIFHTHLVPALVKSREPGIGNDFLSPVTNEWSLVFGSGPKNRSTIDTDETAKFYSFDLTNLTLTKQFVQSGASTVPNSFVGGLRSVDWNNDYIDDVVYFGTSGKDATSTNVDDHVGGLFRYKVDGGSTNLFFNAQRPITVRPLARTSSQRDFVYFGTGRYLYDGDVETTQPEKYYGLMEIEEALESSNYTNAITGGILDVDQIVVNEDGEVSGTGVPTGVTTFSELQNHILTDATTTGWSRELATPTALPSERVIADSTSIKTQIFYTSFSPTDNICAADSGTSNATVIDLISGTASDFGGLGFDANGDAITTISLGTGRASLPQLVVAAGLGSNKGRLIIQKDNGELANDPSATGAPIVTLGVPLALERVNWREIRND